MPAVSPCGCAAASSVELSAYEGQLTLRSVCSHYGYYFPAIAPPKYNRRSRDSVAPPSAAVCSSRRLVGFCSCCDSSSFLTEEVDIVSIVTPLHDYTTIGGERDTLSY